MFHEHSDDDVDKNELRHQNEDDEEDWSDDWTDAAVVFTVVRVVAVVTQRVLIHNSRQTAGYFFVSDRYLVCSRHSEHSWKSRPGCLNNRWIDQLGSFAGTTMTYHQLTCGEDPPRVVIRE